MTNAKVLLSFLLLAVTGFASLRDGHKHQQPSSDLVQLSLASCRDHFNDLDATIEVAGTRDGGEARMENFPYLRVNRFLASFAVDFQTDNARTSADFAAWVAELRTLDHTARAARNCRGQALTVGCRVGCRGPAAGVRP
jgi:hypothetical protein